MRTHSPLLAGLVLASACGNVQDTAPDAPAPDAPGSSERCDPAKPFGAPVLVENVNSSNDEFDFTVTRDERTGFVARIAQPPVSSATILVTQRAQAAASFTAPAGVLTASLNNAPGEEAAPSSTADGLILYFHRQSGGTVDIFAAGRVDAESPFSAGAAVTVDGNPLVNTIFPTISADGQTLYFVELVNSARLYAATRGASPTAFTGRRAVSSMGIGGPPVLSADELTMYYAQVNGVDVFVSTRGSKEQQFGTGVPVADVNSTMDDRPAALSHDGCVLYISSARPGGLGGRDIWQAIRPR
jgi:hypothetical protein